MNGKVLQSFTGMVRKIRNITQSLTGEKFQLIQIAAVVGGVIRNTTNVLADTTHTHTTVTTDN